MKSHRQLTILAISIVLSFVLSVLFVKSSSATIGLITRPDLTGNWQIALTGRTGCGLVSMLVNVSLDYTGKGTNAAITTHGECGDSTVSGQTFQILSLVSTTGSGTANLSCGVGCGWNFKIQVSPDRSIFNLVDVDPVNPGNYIGGMAIHQ